MYRGTTPLVKWVISTESVEFGDIEQIWMTFKDENDYKITANIDQLTLDEEERSISYNFSQEETLRMHAGLVESQLRVLLKDGSAFATEIKTFKIDRILKGGVIE